MKVDQRLQSDLSRDITLLSGLLHLVRGRVQRCHVGVVVLGVVELHDLAADGGFEFAIAVWWDDTMSVSVSFCATVFVSDKLAHSHGRSGRVALPRVKVVLAMAARLVAEGALARRAERAIELRNIAVDMIASYCGLSFVD